MECSSENNSPEKPILKIHLYNNPKILSTGHFLTNDFYPRFPVVVDGDYAFEPEDIRWQQYQWFIDRDWLFFCHEFGTSLRFTGSHYNTSTTYSSTDQGLGNWVPDGWRIMGRRWCDTCQAQAHMSAGVKRQLGLGTPTFHKNSSAAVY